MTHIEAGGYDAHKVDKVFLDGVEVKLVTALDTVEGWLTHLVTDEQGKLVEDINGDLVVKRLTGTITLTWIV